VSSNVNIVYLFNKNYNSLTAARDQMRDVESSTVYFLQLYILGQLPEQNVLHLLFSIFC